MAHTKIFIVVIVFKHKLLLDDNLNTVQIFDMLLCMPPLWSVTYTRTTLDKQSCVITPTFVCHD